MQGGGASKSYNLQPMRFFVLILLFALLALSQLNTIVDSDLWCHLKSGEYIVKNLSVPAVDIFSYTLENQPWVDHEWLSQIFFYLIFVKFGWLGINLFKAIIISSCFLILLFFIISKYKKSIYAVFFILFSVLAFGYRSFVRPEIFSYLMACLFFCILEDEKKIFILPLLQILWVNLHGYFILGPMLIFLYLAGELICGNLAKAKRLSLALCLAIAACFINPYFYKGAVYPVKILESIFTGQSLYMRNIHELMTPINAGMGRYVFFWVFAVLTSMTFLVNIKKARIQHVLVFLCSFTASYMAIRNMPVFIFMAMPLAAINLNEADSTKNIADKKYYILAALFISAAIYLFVSNKYYAYTKQFPFKKTESKMTGLLTPYGACDFLKNNNIKGRIFNSIDFGHYIAYKFYPEKRIFIDPRTELYKDDFYRAYQKAQNYPKEWEKLRKQYGFDIAIIRHVFGGTERLLKYLYNEKDWALVYYDVNSAVFLRATPENKKFIEKFRIDFSKKDIKKSDETMSIAGFFEKIGETRLAENAYAGILKSNPDFLEAGNNLAVIYINTGRFNEALDGINKLLKRYPGSAELYCNKGTVYLRTNRKEEGLLMLEKSAGLNPYLRQASYMLGIVYLEKGKLDKAMRQFIKYLAMDPYNAGGHRILGDIYRQKGLLKKAEAEYNEADALEGK